jgi:O-antigen/teichoic acid export membrane protein
VSGQSARAGSLYLVLAVGLSGVLTYVFQFLSTRALGLNRYGALATLWSATFLVAQILWTGVTQTLGRHIAEREARGEDWAEVASSVRRLQLILLGAFLLASLAGSALLTRLFGDWKLTLAFIAAVAGYAYSYYRRGLLSGHRQFGRLSGMFVVESAGRVLVAAALLAAGAGVVGPAAGIALAPLLSVWLIRRGLVPKPEREGARFSIGGALGFAGPVLLCTACAQALANGGPLLVSALGGATARRQSGLLFAGLILTRAPQYVLSPAIANLLPHLSRLAAMNDRRGFDRFVGTAVGIMAAAGLGLVGGTWLLGEKVMPLFGKEFRLERGLLTVLAVVAACYLLGELLNQVLFARGLARLAATGWLLGIAVTGLATWLIRAELLERVALALGAGTATTVLALAAAHLLTLRGRPLAAEHPTFDDELDMGALDVEA